MSSMVNQWGTCMDRSCGRAATIPQFSQPLSAPRRDGVQPKWYCATHAPKHLNVSPVNGDRRHAQHKSYLKKEGEFVPLKIIKKGGVNGKAA